MRTVGELEWHQMSQWDLSPPDCIEKYQKEGKHNFHFYLRRCTDVISESHSKWETVKDVSVLSEKMLKERNCDFYLKKNYVRFKIDLSIFSIKPSRPFASSDASTDSP